MRALLIASLALMLSACCKKHEPCHSCPLTDGSTCPPGMVNVFNNCQCPEGSFEFLGGCIFPSNYQGTYWGDIDCKCLGKIVLTPNEGSYGIKIENNGNIVSFSSSLTGDPNNFEILFSSQEFNCNLLPNPNRPRFVGHVINDTLNLNVYWHELGPNFDNPVDSCVNIKLAPAWKP